MWIWKLIPFTTGIKFAPPSLSTTSSSSLLYLIKCSTPSLRYSWIYTTSSLIFYSIIADGFLSPLDTTKSSTTALAGCLRSYITNPLVSPAAILMSSYLIPEWCDTLIFEFGGKTYGTAPYKAELTLFLC